jgi:hypothetical protein
MGQEHSSFFDFVQHVHASTADGERAGGAAPAAAGGSLYLEQDRNTVTERSERGREWIEVRSCGCRSWFCERCCLPRGIELKRRLKPELSKFTGLMMLTFTVDPQLFDGPKEAYIYVKSKRCIARTMQQLHRWGHLHSRRYLVVVEWQKESEYPHWHVLVDASRIPFDRLCEAWNRNWKGWKERVQMGRPGFGSVRFSKERVDRETAAGYVTAYLTKRPEHGYPTWVTDSSVGSVRRYEASRGFWTNAAEQVDESEEEDSKPAEEAGAGDQDKPERRTIREQVEECGSRCVILVARESVNIGTGEVEVEREFLAAATCDLEAVINSGPGPDDVNKRRTVAVYRDVAAFRMSLARRGLAFHGREGDDKSNHREIDNHAEGRKPQRRTGDGDHQQGLQEFRGRRDGPGVCVWGVGPGQLARLEANPPHAFGSHVEEVRGDSWDQVP